MTTSLERLTAVEPHLRILHTLAQAVGRSLDVDEVLTTALDALTHVTGHEISSLHLISEDGEHLHLRGERRLSPMLRDVNRVLPVGRGQLGGVAKTGVTLLLTNAADDPTLLPQARTAMDNDRIRGLVSVAIHSRGRILGTLTLGRRIEDPFTEREVALVEAAADQIGIALDNARLYSEARQQLESLRSTQAQLIHAAKLSAVGELASGVAHEINNPLTTIRAQQHLLLTQHVLADAVRERLNVIGDEAERAARIVRDLLMFARHYPAEQGPCLLQDQVRRVLDLSAYALQYDGIEVVTEFDSCPPLSADEHQLQQVLLNLVQNARQAMASQATPRILTVRIRVQPKSAVLSVLDTGPGIAPETLPHVFDPFFTTKPPNEGSGLGLSISYGIVSEHGGRLWAENRPEGGAIFHVELPFVR
jgi:two-component system NtrC family sensor kinase